MSPLTAKGKEIMSSMTSQYGPKKGQQVFYASINAGKVKGAEGGQHTHSSRHLSAKARKH